ncbi:MAG TPA: GGDEF domain-containing protein [Dehalococcoidia bacterium]|nr:GGDEF domain-containing protein [Dehalococcoidia bacterium]
MRWLTLKKDGKTRTAPEPFVAIESLDSSRPEGREGRLFDLVILSLYLHSAGSSHEIVGAFIERAPAVTEAVFVYPLVLDKKRDVLSASPLEGIVQPDLERAMDAFQEDLTALELDLPMNHFRHLVIDGGEVVIRDSMTDFWSGVIPAETVAAAEAKLGIKKVALVPMLVEGEPYGMVAFGFSKSEIDAEIVELLVGHFTLAMRDIATQEDTARFNDIDPVTWVYNKRYIGEAIESELVRCGRYAKTLSLVVIDLDDFGAFNGQYGQTMGDRLLRSAAVSLAEAVSAPEVVARLGDDEFAVLLPETNRAAAVSVTTRLLASLSQVSVFGTGGSPEPLKASVAIVCFPEDGTSAKDLLESAYSDLREAKREREELAKAAPRQVNPLARAANERMRG